MGHSFSIRQIKDAIFICQKSNLTLESNDGNTIVSSQLFETVGLQTRKDWMETGNKTKCFVRFNTLVTRSIRNRTFRQLNYKTCMAYKKSLARWLHKRMSHVYTQASWSKPYSILLTTILRDSGAKRYGQLKDNLSEIRKVLKEMIQQGVIAHYKEEKRLAGRKMVEVKFIIVPSLPFVRDIISANKRLNALQSEKIYSFSSPKGVYPQ